VAQNSARAALPGASGARGRASSSSSPVQVVCIAHIAKILWQEAPSYARVEPELNGLVALVALMFMAHLRRTYELTYMLRSLGVR
jgi:hypothetical protein